MHERAYYGAAAPAFIGTSSDQILGALAKRHSFALDALQRDAWLRITAHLKDFLPQLPEAYVFLEFTIPRMGRRADAIVLCGGLVFVLEYKVGESQFSTAAIDQAFGYALDLKNFHEDSHHRTIVPILIATGAANGLHNYARDPDGVVRPIFSNGNDLQAIVTACIERWKDTPLDPLAWSQARYKPTPTIVEAAQALYAKHDVASISRSEAGAENLTVTAQYIGRVIEHAKATKTKSICFVTGVPGSGKTLAGLNIANLRMDAHADEHAVFLSGNGPLVDVLRAALAQDVLQRPRSEGTKKPTRMEEEKKAAAFIQNIHHFRDDNLGTIHPPVERVVVFDEAQRAWNAAQTSRFMREKRGQADFNMSEPTFLLSVMDRHEDWCCVICLVGEGQEINSGEVGISEWFTALKESFPHWRAHLSDEVIQREPAVKALLDAGNVQTTNSLHLAVSLRSFRAERVSDFIGHIIEGDATAARSLGNNLDQFEIVLTRELSAARRWLRSRRRGTECAGLLASSNALRLKPEGIYVKAKIEPAQWFLAPRDDIRSCDALEDVATEFDVQGLELDWAGVCWDANFRRANGTWSANSFVGTRWQLVRDEARQRYLANTYRVLLTRARQGMVIFVPQGDLEDKTRPPDFYDATYEFLKDCGLSSLDVPS
ncbi:MAG: 8-oxo-dGTP diphosphatase [Bradyrhizobium sp.]|nr:8-oxo-dGTP diphosphatase [Bradyrhizobium sp.]